jgi:hypothetical protein
MDSLSCKSFVHVDEETPHLYPYAKQFEELLESEAVLQGVQANSEVTLWSPPDQDIHVKTADVRCLFFKEVDPWISYDIARVLERQRQGFIFTFSISVIPKQFKSHLLTVANHLHGKAQPVVEFHAIRNESAYIDLHLREVARKILERAA